MNIYKELFQTRKQIFFVSSVLDELTCNCRQKCSLKDSIEMEKLHEKLENLEIKRYILEKLLNKFVFG